MACHPLVPGPGQVFRVRRERKAHDAGQEIHRAVSSDVVVFENKPGIA
jgi:hypothetical protein